MQISTRKLRWLIALLGAFVLYCIVGFFVAPWIVRSQAQKRLSEMLGREVLIGKVALNPFTFRAEIRDFEIREAGGKQSFVSWKCVVADFDPTKSFSDAWVLGELRLDGFQAAILRDKEGKMNFADILARFESKPTTPAAAPSKPGRPLRIAHLEVNDARIAFSDRFTKTPFATTFAPLSFRIDNLVTLGESAPGHFEAVTSEGERYSWTGTLSLEPLATKGSISVEGFRLGKHYPYAERWLRLEAPSGLVSLKLNYAASLDKDGPHLSLSGGSVGVQNLKLTEKGAKTPFFNLAKFSMEGLEAAYPNPSASISGIEIEGLTMGVRRDADGSINLLKLLESETDSKAPTAASSGPATPAPKLKLASLQVRGATINVSDLSTPSAADLALNNLQFSLRDISLENNQRMPLSLGFDWAPSGKVSVQGSVTVFPSVSATLESNVDSLALAPLSPYVEQFTGLHLVEGSFSEKSVAKIELAGNALRASATGDLRLEKLGVALYKNSRPSIGVGDLSVAGFEANIGQDIALSVERVGIRHPFAKLVLKQGNKIDLLEALRLPAAQPAQASGAATATPASTPKVLVKMLELTDTELQITDTTIAPLARFELSRFGGSIANITLEPSADLQVKLSGLFGKAGKVSVEGHVQPFAEKRLADVHVELSEIDLLAFSPYSGKFAGYTIAEGHLSFDTQTLLQGSALKVSNKVDVQDFTFGEATHNPEAVKLPVRLGVALLKDKNGRIELEIPIEGSLEDPQFRIGKAVWHVVGTLLTKAATSPFSLLGSMFGGGGDELSFQNFTPGSSVLTPTAQGKLEVVGKALANRPGLKLDITPSFSREEDGRALRTAKLEELIRTNIAVQRELTAKMKHKPEVPATAEQERHSALAALYAQQFPATETKAVESKPETTVKEAPQKTSTLRKVARFLKFWDRKPTAPSVAAAPKPVKNKDKEAALPSDGEMEAKLREAQVLPDQALVELAQARANTVRDRLSGYHRIAEERLSLLPAVEKNTRVELKLK